MHAFILNSLNSLSLDINASLDVAEKKHCIFRMCMETITKLFVWFSFLLNKSINNGPMVRVSDIREGHIVNVHEFVIYCWKSGCIQFRMSTEACDIFLKLQLLNVHDFNYKVKIIL